MVSPLGGKPTLRIARFLRRCVKHVDKVAAVPLLPLLAETIFHKRFGVPRPILLYFEDMMILGGFSVLGEPITSPLSEELVKIEDEITKEHKRFYKSKARKASHSSWMNHFMESGSDLEHVAFLTLWLSRYVFPSHPEELIGRHVFSIAIHLAQGITIALAPAILATLYRDLRLLNDQVVSSDKSATVWAPFQLLQAWAWERFPVLRPKTPNSLPPDEPRLARWHKLNSNLTLPLRDELSNAPVVEDELRSFARCLRACELVGLDCIEQYLPNRVAMMFGMDQDLPGTFCYNLYAKRQSLSITNSYVAVDP
ncbi:hypothetical protein HHK36_023795 [Tetracentron sinense]|uniref:Aminotransferase-like plant mobile domain-containing protein n=1 Tax=Tetracentron sinense TaxID=13715 RepID=A0A834YNT8_TETSI|nr:hypothetical protein HHK36_023795 [Tetracentron sinense]